MIDLNLNEFMLLWGLYAILFICGFGLGYVYAILKMLKEKSK